MLLWNPFIKVPCAISNKVIDESLYKKKKLNHAVLNTDILTDTLTDDCLTLMYKIWNESTVRKKVSHWPHQTINNNKLGFINVEWKCVEKNNKLCNLTHLSAAQLIGLLNYLKTEYFTQVKKWL
jgi:hypothetical protein